MKALTVAGWLVLLLGALLNPLGAFMWMSAVAVPLVAAGFLWGPRSSFLMAAASSVAGALLVYAGVPSEAMVGPWALFGLLPLILWDKNWRLTGTYALLEARKEGLLQQLQTLSAGASERRFSIRSREEAIQQIIELYGLSKDFLGTLDEEQALQIVGEAIDKWAGALGQKEKIDFLASLRMMLDRGDVKVNDLVALSPAAANGHAQGNWGIVVGQLALGLQRVSLYRQVQESAIHDGLTGLLVRRYLRERLFEEVSRAVRRDTGLAFLMIDIDHFKKVNDTYGHLVGDVVLRETARLITSSVREIDLVGRYGGEEFAVVLPEANRDLGIQIAERIRQTIEQTAIQAYDEKIRVTVSIGVNFLPGGGKLAEQLVEKADEALYKAKRAGRNKVAATEPGE